MDYVEMIKDPELVLGFQELISDSDHFVVKRTVKVFTSVYHHTLRLLSAGELKEETLVSSWSSVGGVVDTLIGMVKNCSNEGTLIYLLRFLEAAVTSHLMYDLSDFPFVCERGREIVKTGLKSLKDLVTTPYVGGSAYIMGVRALISIACLRPDLWEPVTDLLKKQLRSLPPTLFDHDVRSLNKMLQKNLFRLLRRAETRELRDKLIEMMVSVGCPRKIILPWAKSSMEVRKRGSPTRNVDSDSQTPPQTPPEKKARLTEENAESEHYSPRSDSPDIPADPRLAPQDSQKNSQQTIASAISKESSASLESKIISNDLIFLTSLIPTKKKVEASKTKESSLEKELFDALDIHRVCSLIIHSVDAIPDKEPQNFVESFEKEGHVTDDIKTMKERLSEMLNKYLSEHNIKSLSQATVSKANSPQRLSDPTEDSITKLPQASLVTQTTSIFSNSSTLAAKDTDLRQAYPRLAPPLGDVDMRISDPRLASRDPRLAKDPRLRKDLADPRMTFSQQKDHRVDPRLDNRTLDSKPRLDPRVQNTNDKKSENRKTRWDPRTPALASANPSTGAPPTSSNTTDTSLKPNDPRTIRPQSIENPAQFPHPDQGSLQPQDMVASRMPFQPLPVSQAQQMPNDPRMQHQAFIQQPQPGIQFGPFNPINQFGGPFMASLQLPPSSMPPPLMGNPPPFGWQNGFQNPPPTFMVAQSLASVQRSLLPPTMINL